MPQAPDKNWIEQFRAAHGRAPRILHVGNINNNAYQTSKMLNAAGADCDVLCADYYHSMGNPEWDDADIEGDVGNQFFPAFHKVNLNGFERPRWFSQGPRKQAIAYLIARRAGQTARAERLWQKLERSRRYLVFKDGSSLKPLLEWWERFRFSAGFFFKFCLLLLGELFTKPGIFFLRFKNKFGRLNEEEQARLDALDDTAAIVEWLYKEAAELFPDRSFSFGNVARDHIRGARDFASLFAQYDIVQAYAVDPVWPYLAGYENYVGYEHGTLRDTPYEDNDLSRLALLAYARAKVVYVTNVDCFDSAVYITKNSGAPIVCGLHGFDTERMMEKQQLALQGAFDRRQYAPDGVPLFFAPARVDIDPHYGTYLKKNDMLFRALGRLYRERGGGFRVLQLEAGQDTAALKALIHEECPELEEAVQWHVPFQKVEFYQILQNCELVFDNLLLPLMSGNGIETLMSGHATLVNKRISEEMMLRFFAEMWPILPIEDEDGIYAAAQKALEAPEECRTIAKNGQAWILKYHNHAEIVKRNLASYALIYPFED